MVRWSLLLLAFVVPLAWSLNGEIRQSRRGVNQIDAIYRDDAELNAVGMAGSPLMSAVGNERFDAARLLLTKGLRFA